MCVCVCVCVCVSQVESTVAIQALQPRVKELQLKYANDQETLQVETARLYQAAGENTHRDTHTHTHTHIFTVTEVCRSPVHHLCA